MPPVSPNSVHYERTLTNFSLSYMLSAERFVAWRVFPNLPVPYKSDKYWSFPREYMFTEGFRKKAPGSRGGRVTYAMDSDGHYSCDVWSEEIPVEHQTKSNADSGLDPENFTTQMLTQHALVKLEKDFCDTFFKTGVWTTELSGVDTSPGSGEVRVWSNASASDPLTDIENLKVEQGELTGYEPNKLVIGRRVWKALRNHPDIVDRVKYGQTPGAPAKVTLQAVAALMELDEILVASVPQATAQRGKTPTFSYIAGNHAMLVYAPGTIGWREPVSGAKFSWDQEAPSNDQGGVIRSWYEEGTETTFQELKMAYDMKVIAPDLGCFLKDVVAS